MKIVMSCGGTGGHIYPAIAIADKIREHHPEAEILFIGTKKGMENSLVPAAGYDIKGIDARGFDRKHLAEDGMIVVVVSLSSEGGSLISGPDIITRGFVYVKESGDLMEELHDIAEKAVDDCVDQGITDWSTVKASIKSSLSNYLFRHTKRNPMILPVIMEI